MCSYAKLIDLQCEGCGSVISYVIEVVDDNWSFVWQLSQLDSLLLAIRFKLALGKDRLRCSGHIVLSRRCILLIGRIPVISSRETGGTRITERISLPIGNVMIAVMMVREITMRSSILSLHWLAT